MIDPKQFYDKSWQQTEERFEKRYPIILEMVGTNKKVLDIGCGKGLLSSLIQKQNNNVIGIDISDKALKETERKGIKVKKVNLEDGLPFSNDGFDCVVCSEVIEHLFDPLKLLKEIRRVLKNDGLVIITIPNIAHLIRRLIFLFGVFPEDHQKYRTSGTSKWEHIRFYTLKSVKQLVDEAGFNVVEIKGVGRFSRLSFTLFSWGFCLKARCNDTNDTCVGEE